jgi:hypothetical protein
MKRNTRSRRRQASALSIDPNRALRRESAVIARVRGWRVAS